MIKPRPASVFTFRSIATASLLIVCAGVNATAQYRIQSARRFETAYDTTTTAITRVNVIPMDRERVLTDQTVIIRGGRISTIGPSSSTRVPPGARTISGEGKFLMPGLADMHVHLNYQDSDRQDNSVFLSLFLANGVTTVLNLLGVPQHFALRDQIQSGAVFGPAVYTSGFYINEPFVRTPAQVDSAIAAQLDQRVDVIKTHGPLSDSAFAHLVSGAHKAGLRIIGHVDSRQGVLKVERDGMDAIAHAEEFLAGYWGFQRTEPLTAESIPVLIKALADSTRRYGTWVIPTLSVFRGISDQASNLDSVLARPEVRYLPPATTRPWLKGANRYERIPKDAVESLRNQYGLLKRQTKGMYNAGVPLLAGTDSPVPSIVPGFSLHDELAELVSTGLTPYDALRAATGNAASFLNAQNEFGTIAIGVRADLVLLNGNPLEDIENTRTIAGVMVRGRWLGIAELDAMLAGLKR